MDAEAVCGPCEHGKTGDGCPDCLREWVEDLRASELCLQREIRALLLENGRLSRRLRDLGEKIPA